MKLVIVWKEESDRASEVREWLRDFEHDVGPGKIESIDPETREGNNFAETYDVVEYPTILAIDSNGKVLQMWRGVPMPQIEKVAYWASNE